MVFPNRVTDAVFAYAVPVPFARVFHPPKVYPARVYVFAVNAFAVPAVIDMLVICVPAPPFASKVTANVPAVHFA